MSATASYLTIVCSAGFAGAFIDREVETKGVRCLDPFMGKNIKLISFLA